MTTLKVFVIAAVVAVLGCAPSHDSGGVAVGSASAGEVGDAVGNGRLRQRLLERRQHSGDEPAKIPGERLGSPTFRTLSLGGRDRQYLFMVPPAAKTSGKLPLVIALHGALGDAERFATVTGWVDKGRREGFIVAIPNGTPKIASRRVWNAGTCCAPANDQGVDDVAFIAAIIDDVRSQGLLDERRVYLTGFSNGAMMTHRAGCELSQRLAAIAAVSGTLGIPACQPSRPIAVLQLHGRDDTKVPLQGVQRRSADFTFGSAFDTVAVWRRAEKCGAETRRFQPAAGVQCEEAVGCRAGATVQFCIVDGLGHEWAAGSKSSAGTFSATDYIWDFFSRHTAP
jgi:polyhydroxybutyrate depolymerase